MMRANFYIDRVEGDKVFLVDKDIGMSVTNDAENVVKYLLTKYPETYRFIYKDTMGMWDELKHDGEQFTGFYPYNVK